MYSGPHGCMRAACMHTPWPSFRACACMHARPPQNPTSMHVCQHPLTQLPGLLPQPTCMHTCNPPSPTTWHVATTYMPGHPTSPYTFLRCKLRHAQTFPAIGTVIFTAGHLNKKDDDGSEPLERVVHWHIERFEPEKRKRGVGGVQDGDKQELSAPCPMKRFELEYVRAQQCFQQYRSDQHLQYHDDIWKRIDLRKSTTHLKSHKCYRNIESV